MGIANASKDMNAEQQNNLLWDMLEYDARLFAIKLAQGLSPEDAAKAVSKKFEDENQNIIGDEGVCEEWKEVAQHIGSMGGLIELENRVKKAIMKPYAEKWEDLIGQDDPFEEKIAEMFNRHENYWVIERTQKTCDGGYDIKVQGPDACILVECKSQGTPVGVQVLRSLVGVLVREMQSQGILTCLGGFTNQAIEEVDKINISALIKNQAIKIDLWGFGEIIAFDMEVHGYLWAREFLPEYFKRR
jgi:hypothetical protein